MIELLVSLFLDSKLCSGQCNCGCKGAVVDCGCEDYDTVARGLILRQDELERVDDPKLQAAIERFAEREGVYPAGGRGWLWSTCNPGEVNYVRHQYAHRREYPPISDVRYLPGIKETKRCLEIAEQRVRSFDALWLWVVDTESAGEERDKAFAVWSMWEDIAYIHDAITTKSSAPYRFAAVREKLKRIQDTAGRDAFYRGEFPLPTVRVQFARYPSRPPP